MDRMPTELCALVIEHIEGDDTLTVWDRSHSTHRDSDSPAWHEPGSLITRTLKALCLVNSAWHQLAAPALASRVYFRLDWQKSCERLRSFLARHLPDQCQLTHTVFLDFRRRSMTPDDQIYHTLAISALTIAADPLLSKIIDSLPRLRNLTIQASNSMDVTHYPKLHESLGRKKGLQSVTISEMPPECLQSWVVLQEDTLRCLVLRLCDLNLRSVECIAVCPQLETLSLVQCALPNDDDLKVRHVNPSCRLRTLEITCDLHDSFDVIYVPFLKCRPTLRSLTIFAPALDGHDTSGLDPILIRNSAGPIGWPELRTLTLGGRPDMMRWASCIDAPALETAVLEERGQDVGGIIWGLMRAPLPFRRLAFWPCFDKCDHPFLAKDREVLSHFCEKAGVNLFLPLHH